MPAMSVAGSGFLPETLRGKLPGSRRRYRLWHFRNQPACQQPQPTLGLRIHRAQPQSVSAAESRAQASPQRRSEEHTSELQSLMRISYAVFCLKKKKNAKETLQYVS